jgi:hypothetical protein
MMMEQLYEAKMLKMMHREAKLKVLQDEEQELRK